MEAGASDVARRHDREAIFHRLFFAVNPDPQVATDLWRRAERYRSRRRLAGRPTPPELLHITLNGVGAFPRLDGQVVARARAAASRVAARRFVVSLNRLVSWEGARRPLVLTGGDGVIGVDDLHRQIRLAMADVGLASRRAPGFEPHLTLLRDRVETPPQWIAPVNWQVREFVLVHSPHGLSRHDVLGRWPLLD
jgi:2'-5' RNA ligase